MKNNNRILFFFLISILLININFAKTSSNDDEAITKKSEDQKYIIVVNNTYGEFSIFSNPNDKKNVKRQELKSYEFAISLMDKIDEIIIENKDTYKDKEKLEEIENQNLLRKRDNEDEIVSNYDNSSFVNPIASNGETLLISAYLSKALVEKIEKMENIETVFPDFKMEYESYYNTNDILKETSWKALSVQANADLQLSIISQGLYKEDVIEEYDTNYYYPNSNEEVDVIIIDSGFDFSHSEFSNSERTAVCKVYFEGSKAYKPSKNKKCGSTTVYHGRQVADVVGGRIHGVAKKANIYGIAIPVEDNSVDFDDVILALQYVKENLVRSNRTVINISIGKDLNSSDSSVKSINKLIDAITGNGGIIVASSGNKNKNVKNGSVLHMPCSSKNVICVGGISSYQLNDVKNKFQKYQDSNYGDEVEIYAPHIVKAKLVENGVDDVRYYAGTSYSAAMVSGGIATIISGSNVKYNKEKMLTFLKNKGIPFKVNSVEKKVLNNGKHIVYSKNGKYHGCGVSAGNTSCNYRCGPNYGQCEDQSACCSKKNYCGTTSAYCGTGCQPKYGLCTSSEEDRCGSGYGRCAKSNECCSKYGWCGTTSEYCGTGCQSRYGICN